MTPAFSLVEVVEFIVELELVEAKSSTSMSNPFMPRARSISYVTSSVVTIPRSESTESAEPRADAEGECEGHLEFPAGFFVVVITY